MSILSQNVDTEEDCLFEAYLDCVKNISVLLKAVNFKDVCMAVVLSFACLFLTYRTIYVFEVMSLENCAHVLTGFVLFQNGICFATDKGLKVTVEDSKCVQASAFIQREVFQVC
jgi:hypothetical protein